MDKNHFYWLLLALLVFLLGVPVADDLTILSGPAVRALAYLQAVFGQFYVAILVAGLVGAYISRSDNRKADE